MKVYLAGKVAKGDEIRTLRDWRQEYMNVLRNTPEIEFLSPEAPELDESQPILVFGHDCHLIRNADIVVVNASTKLGVGTAQEMLIAKYFGKPVLTVLPKNSHHRRANLVMHAGMVPDWIHPFIFASSDYIADDVEDAGKWLEQYIGNGATIPTKDLGIIDEAITAYLSHVE